MTKKIRLKPKYMRAIRQFGEAAENSSWAGAYPPDQRQDIHEKYDRAKARLVKLIAELGGAEE